MQVVKRLRAFTLVELLIVVVILGILATVVIPVFTEAATNAKSSTLKSHLKGIRLAMEKYKIDHGMYPSPGRLDFRLPYSTNREGKREGDSGYVGPDVGGPYLRGARGITPAGARLLLPFNPFWNWPPQVPGDWSYLAGTDDDNQNPRLQYNTIQCGYVSQSGSPGTQNFHAAWGPEGFDCSVGVEDQRCAYNW